MVDLIILLIVFAVMIFALKGTIKHFKGEGPCCGGGGGTLVREAEKRLANPKIGEKIIRIEGMHCDNCRRSVSRALNKLDGVSAKVNLRKKTAVVSYDREIDEAALRKAVEGAGYQVVSIQ